MKKFPDGPQKHPLLQLLWWMNDTLGYMESGAQHYGDIFAARLGSSNPTIYVSNPQAIAQIFIGESKQFINPGNQLFKPILGQSSLIVLTGVEHHRHRQLILPSFHGSRMKAYGQIIGKVVEKMFDALSPGQTFTARPIMEKISGEIILQSVIGNSNPERFEKLNQLISATLKFAKIPLASSLFFIPFLRQDLGSWSPWGYVCHLLRQIDALIYAEIRDCRERKDTERTDILSLMVAARDEAGEGMSDRELRDEVITLAFGGQDGIASLMAWALYWSHRYPEIRKKLIAEFESLGSTPDPLELFRLPYLNIVFKEMLRISPVDIQTQPRIASEEVEMQGYTLPKGTAVIPSIYLLHRREDLFPDPEHFKPERFLERQFTYYEYIPFGGGSRRCVGAAFAEFILKLVLTKILSSYDLMLTSTEVCPTLSGLNLVPSDGVQMKFIGKRSLHNKETKSRLEISRYGSSS